MIEWQLDLQLPVQSVPISTNVVSSNPADGEVYSIQQYVIKLSPGNPVSSRFKTDRHDIPEILLKAALSTITLSLRRYTDLYYPFDHLQTLLKIRSLSRRSLDK
jgi:hypothetical protein